MNEDDPDNTLIQTVQSHAQTKNRCAISVCNTFESEMAQLSHEERKEFIDHHHESGLSSVIRSVYDVLGLHTFFTAGPQEVRAWPLVKGKTALDAAGVIHTDFQKGFIRAETIHYQDYIDSPSDQSLKESGKLHLKGKDYVMQDGDIIHFRFNV